MTQQFDFASLMGISLSAPPQSTLPDNKITKLIEIFHDVRDFLKNANAFFSDVPESLSWCLQNKKHVINISTQVSNIDSFLSSLALIPQLLQNESIIPEFTTVVSLLPNVRSLVGIFSSRLTVALKYDDLCNHSMEDIADQINSCLLDLSTLRVDDFSPSPNTPDLKQFISEVQSNKSVSLYSLVKPTFANNESSVIQKFELFENRLEPFAMAMHFLIEEVNGYIRLHGSEYPTSASNITNEFNKLQSNFAQLKLNLDLIKSTLIGKRWLLLYPLLVEKITSLLQSMIHDIHNKEQSTDVPDEFGATFRLCSNAIMILRKVLLDTPSDDTHAKEIFNEKIVLKWKLLNDLLTDTKHLKLKPDNEAKPSISERGLRPVRLAQSRTPLAESKPTEINNPNTQLLGIDLQIDINHTSSIPFSVHKEDRIVDLDLSNVPKTSNLNQKLMETKDNSVKDAILDDDTETLVQSRSRDSQDKQKLEFLNARLNARQQKSQPSKIPLIRSDCLQKKFPVIKKKKYPGRKATKIPSISPEHPVFLSPEKRKPSYFATPDHRRSFMEPLVLLSPPVFALPSNKNAWRRISSGSSLGLLTPEQRSRASLLTSRADQLSLAEETTPNLAFTKERSHLDIFTDGISLRSTSPERPGSPMGSRLDDCHLLQPIKVGKRAWK